MSFLKSAILQATPPQEGAVPSLAPTTEKEFRQFADAPVMREWVYNNALEAASNLPPLRNPRYSLELDSVDYVDPGKFTYRDEKDAILRGKTLSRRLRGTWVLRDAMKNVLQRRRQTLAHIPHVTDRGTFIHNGNEYTISNQQRLRPGIFTRVKDNGEIEAHVNILPGEGVAHRYFLDPAKGAFYIRIRQAKIPLMTLARALGATDAQLREAWGPELLAANYRYDQPAALKKLYERLKPRGGGPPPKDLGEMREQLAGILASMRLDPEVTRQTLGKPYDRLSLDVILDTTKKLLAVSRGEADVDDRDHLAFQTFLGPEDLIAERLRKDYGGVRRKLLSKATFKGNLDMIPTNALNRQVEAALLHSGLGQALEEINPSDVFDKQWRLSRMGEGGIPTLDAIPDESRALQPSHLNFIDALRTPESFKTGVDLFLARMTRKGRDGRLYAPFISAKTGKTVYKSPQDIADLAIAFPGEMERPGKRVAAMYQGKLRFVPRDEISFIVPQFEDAMSPLGNLIPLKSMVKGQRAVMAARMLTQALPLTEREAPWVQSAIPGGEGKSFEDEYGKHMGAIRAVAGGVVRAVEPGRIILQTAEGEREIELYDSFPYNRKTYLHQTSVVRPGDQVRPGDLLATSNYTDSKGVTALGRNARVAYIPFRGLNFEDAIVISQSFADKMVSEHMYQQRLDWTEDHRRGRRDYISLFPGSFDRRQLDTIAENGLAKPGTVLQYDDPVILAATVRAPSHHKIFRRKTPSFADATVRWNHHSPGMVTDVVDDEKGSTVLVKSLSPMQVGDKLSGRYSGKGIVSGIVPTEQMPHDMENRPFEILLNPLGVISRGNPAQIVEAALGKIAAKTGEAYKLEDWDGRDMAAFALKELRRHGMSDLESIIDPGTERKIPDVFVGNRWFMKLHHTAESKSQARGIGSYTQEETPARGGETGAKRLSLLNTNALLSHGCTAVSRDASLIRGQRNEDYWLAFMKGYDPPDPKVPAVYEKFVNQLRSAGINVISDGGQLQVMAMTDADVDQLAGNREITSGETVRFEKELEPVPGGLFDPKLTGGHHGGRWSFVRLHEPLPSPVFEEPIRKLLGLTQKRLREILAGRERIGDFTGPGAVSKALDDINVPKEIARARADIRSGRRTARDNAVRKLGYLKACQRLGIHPREWMLSKVPVLPPQFRPISVIEEGQIPLVADANFLYKELIDANNNLRRMSSEVSDIGDERLTLYDAFRAVIGLGDPIHPRLQQKRVRGVLSHIFGSSPKLSVVQRRLIGSSVDVVGRAVISPNPDFDMDTVGLPENRAWDVYKMFIVRRLHRRGLPLLQAARHVKDRTPLAREEMLNEMAERPVFIDRAPVLHRFGIMAFWPRLVKGDVMQISPLVVGGFNADFDGDAMQYHVPVDEAAKQEAIELMLPSKNLLSPRDFATPVYQPTQEYLGGLFAASSAPPKGKRAHYFANRKAAIAAYQRGEISVDTPVVVPT